MKNYRRLRGDGNRSTGEVADAILVDDALLTDGLITAVGKGDGLCGLAAVEHNDDGLPGVAAGMILQAEGDDVLRSIDELQMTAHEVGTAQAEGGMSLAQGNQVLVVLENLRVFVRFDQSRWLMSSGDSNELCTPFLSRNISSPLSMKGTP